MTPVSTALDKTAIGLSLACAIHCLLLPVVITLLPALAASTFGDERFHQWMLLAVLPASLIALGIGCRQHKNLRIMTIGLSGLVVITFSAFFGHDLFGEMGEKVATIVGASLIALSHFRNHALCKRLQCECRSS